jgi:asparagine synthetase B (glutamine-hydrolysing)
LRGFSNIDNFIFNNKLGELRRSEWKPILKDIHPIYPGMYWDHKKNNVQDPCYTPNIRNCSWDTLLNATKDIFLKYKNKRIGVQLSGGLDSSIIICLLDYLEIPFYTVGLSTKRFEFRTEKYIQELLKPLAVDSILIDHDDHLPMSNLNSVPAHQTPDINSLNFSADFAMAIEAKKMGIEILFTGDGGDNLFSESIPANNSFCLWKPQNFTSSWLSEYVYRPKGIELVSFYEEPIIMDHIFNLRKGHLDDNSKLWARSFFSKIIPEELSNYQYRADFWGIYISGFCKAKAEIMNLFDEAYYLTSFKHFSKKYYQSLLSGDYLQTDKEFYQEIESIISVAVWIYGLCKIGRKEN